MIRVWTAPRRVMSQSTCRSSSSVRAVKGVPGVTSALAERLNGGHYIDVDIDRQAAARYGTPPGATEVTVVEYASGHQADAVQVARSLSVSHVEPMEQGVLALAGAANVAVVVGADKATAGP